jgi:hypothetical protein
MDAAMRGIVLFLWLTGLADGLAPKEWRYVQNTIRPNKWVPRFLWLSTSAGIQLCGGAC